MGKQTSLPGWRCRLNGKDVGRQFGNRQQARQYCRNRRWEGVWNIRAPDGTDEPFRWDSIYPEFCVPPRTKETT